MNTSVHGVIDITDEWFDKIYDEIIAEEKELKKNIQEIISNLCPYTEKKNHTRFFREEAEEKWILELKTNDRDYGYNARVHVTNNRGLRHDEVTKKKISENRTGKGKHKYFISEETKQLKREAARKLSSFRTEETDWRVKVTKQGCSYYKLLASARHMKGKGFLLLGTQAASQNHKPIRPLAPSEANGSTHGKILPGSLGEVYPHLIGNPQ